jgi:glutamyl-tRNA synthetase
MMHNTDKVITRIAPSPTGNLHVGTARAALYNFLYARKHQGTFIVRLEDTDKERSKKEYEQDILNGLYALGLASDEVVRQSERVSLHSEHLRRLVSSNKAYVSAEPSKTDPSSMVEVVRLRNPGKVLTFHDEIRGMVTFDTSELGDFVIARNLTDPLYHFAVVVDDADMGVTHVIRGEDHISNTPRQILIQEALGLPRPLYAHLPLLLSPDRSKLSKRKGAVSVSEYLREGFLPCAMLNFLALLGWNPGTDQEIFSLDELVSAFSLKDVQKGGAVFDTEKLKWINREHIKRMAPEEQKEYFLEALTNTPTLFTVFSNGHDALFDAAERVSTKGELGRLVEAGEFEFYVTAPDITREILLWKKDPDPERTRERLTCLIELLDSLHEELFTKSGIRDTIEEYATKEGKGNVLWPLRTALSGRERSPDPFLIGATIGKHETLSRLRHAVLLLERE